MFCWYNIRFCYYVHASVIIINLRVLFVAYISSPLSSVLYSIKISRVRIVDVNKVWSFIIASFSLHIFKLCCYIIGNFEFMCDCFPRLLFQGITATLCIRIWELMMVWIRICLKYHVLWNGVTTVTTGVVNVSAYIVPCSSALWRWIITSAVRKRSCSHKVCVRTWGKTRHYPFVHSSV